jgi:hypothetical protein
MGKILEDWVHAADLADPCGSLAVREELYRPILYLGQEGPKGKLDVGELPPGGTGGPLEFREQSGSDVGGII